MDTLEEMREWPALRYLSYRMYYVYNSELTGSFSTNLTFFKLRNAKGFIW